MEHVVVAFELLLVELGNAEVVVDTDRELFFELLGECFLLP